MGRDIRYFGEYREGERLRGCGFAKLEYEGGRLSTELSVRGIGGVTGEYPVWLLRQGGESQAGKLQLAAGAGSLIQELQMEEEVTGIRIPLGEGWEIGAFWGLENGGKGGSWKEGTGEKTSENRKMSMKEREIIQEEIGREENREAESKTGGTGNQAPVDFLEEEKWEQLWKLYPRIRPFRDDREYLSVTPADFVMLPEGSYRNAHNSFLMHGFYRYHHLLLFRYEKKGEVIYYLGVPGNFHEQDRQVAVMFGFESFECAAEPAQEGDFGYFLMRTEL